MAHSFQGLPSKTALETWARGTSDPAGGHLGTVYSRPGHGDGRPVLPGASAF